ncbi:hypothetical protein MN116_002578 [Schistosoma mekongi]|uniref:Uncharacterized protein n=1 Tax=Schistosoma mekongi TaxID=38744 RepID=A0AAE2D5Q2_SCHME|nr:hypothetical protein MN116_002578 [Schistosoma mekongi]
MTQVEDYQDISTEKHDNDNNQLNVNKLNKINEIIRIKRYELHNLKQFHVDNDNKEISSILDNIKEDNVNKKQTITSIYQQSNNNQLLHNTIDNDKLLRPEKCIPIEIPLCKNIGYNLTYMPNAFNHETQEEAGLEVHQFYPLVEINCSEDLRLFLCSMYTPICLPTWHYRLTACKSLCESARDGCMPVMRTYGFGWPERMNCDLLPEGNNSTEYDLLTLIHQINSDNSLLPSELLQILSSNPLHSNNYNFSLNQLNDYLINKKNKLENKKFLIKTSSKSHNLQPVLCLPCKCRQPFIDWMKSPLNEIITGDIKGCLLSCYNPIINNNQSDKTFITFWLGLWSILCILSTLMTIGTFLTDSKRFQYPERSIIYLSLCYLMIAIGYLLRVTMGHELIACDGPILRINTTGPIQCSLVFLLTYVFGMASSIWWIILTLTWFLAAGLKWSTEAIAKYSQIYHFLAWFFPGIQAIIIFILSGVDGDSISGLCTVGSINLTYLRLFLLIPMCIYLSIGSIFLLAGFIALFKIRNQIKLQTKNYLKTEKLEKLIIRIGIFSVLYTVPVTIVIACYYYELYNRDYWHKSHNCPCLSNRSPQLPINTNSIDWNIEQSKSWMNINNNCKLSNETNLNVNNYTIWQDDYITNNRLLSQQPSVSHECYHSTGICINYTMSMPTGSIIGTPNVTLSGLQVNSNSFTNNPLDSTVISTCSASNLPIQQQTGRKIDSNNLFIMSSIPITHI